MDRFGQMKAIEVVNFIKDQVGIQEQSLKTRIIPYDLQQAVSNDNNNTNIRQVINFAQIIEMQVFSVPVHCMSR